MGMRRLVQICERISDNGEDFYCPLCGCLLPGNSWCVWCKKAVKGVKKGGE